jgi:transposase
MSSPAAAAARRRLRCWARAPAPSWSTCTPATTRSRAPAAGRAPRASRTPRRHLFDAIPYAPEARAALELIRDVYVVEHDAKAAGIARTAEHTNLRRARARPIMDRLRAWLDQRKDQYAPKGPMASAIRYALSNWDELTRFLDDARIPPDNTRSESALRIVALGRKNFLFVGHEEAGANIAGLYSLTATCEANGVEPIAHLTDVLGRVGSHPAAALDDLLPHNWRPPG